MVAQKVQCALMALGMKDLTRLAVGRSRLLLQAHAQHRACKGT